MKNKILFLTAAMLKIIGMVTMVIDHVGVMFFEHIGQYYNLYRIIGRIAFVIFAFLITDGMIHSKNKIKYIIQMLVIGLIIQLVEMFILGMDEGEVMSTLGLSALIIYFLQKTSWKAKIFSLIPFGLIVLGDMDLDLTAFEFQYGIYGCFMIVGFYYCYILGYKIVKKYNLNKDIEMNEYLKSVDFIRIRNVISCIFLIILNLIYAGVSYIIHIRSYYEIEIQLYSMLGVLFIIFYNGRRGYNKPWFKWFCYFFYPLQFILVFVAYMLFG